jgi:DNA mismatch endonuclease (patch repair protein)
MGLRYRVDITPLKGVRRRADIVFTSVRVAVFVDGCFWHCCPQHGTSPANNAEWWRAKLNRNVERDRETDHLLEQAGWMVVRVWEHTPPDEAASLVAGVVQSAREAQAATRAGAARPELE